MTNKMEAGVIKAASCREYEPQVGGLRPGKGVYVYLPEEEAWQVRPEGVVGKGSELDRLNDPRYHYKGLKIVSEKAFARSKKLQSLTSADQRHR